MEKNDYKNMNNPSDMVGHFENSIRSNILQLEEALKEKGVIAKVFNIQIWRMNTPLTVEANVQIKSVKVLIN